VFDRPALVTYLAVDLNVVLVEAPISVDAVIGQLVSAKKAPRRNFTKL
jgi:hypothetical protein